MDGATEWPRASQRVPRRTLTQRSIVEAALDMLMQDGLEAITMRAVATSLRTGAASLYAHVSNKEELYELMLDELLGRLEIPQPDPSRWVEQLNELVLAQFQLLTEYPGIARVALETIVPTGPNALRIAEGFLAILRAGGLSDRVAVLAFDTLSLWSASFAYEMSMALSAGTDPEIAKRSAQIGAYIEERAGQYPNLVSVGPVLADATIGERLKFALNTFLTGLSKR